MMLKYNAFYNLLYIDEQINVYLCYLIWFSTLYLATVQHIRLIVCFNINGLLDLFTI